MALTKISRSLLDTGVSDSSDATAITIDSSENVGIGLTSPQTTFGKAGTLDANGVIIARGGLGNHETDAIALEYYNGISRLRAYGASAGTGILAFNTGGGGDSTDTERMRIDSSGNVGIGTSSPASDSGYSTLSLSNTTGGQVVFQDDGTTMAGILGNATNMSLTTVGSRYINFNTNGSERMRISAGDVLVGKTATTFSTAGIHMQGSTGRTLCTVSGDNVMDLNRTTSNGVILGFYLNGSSVGTISTNTHSLPSDRNFKTDISDLNLGLNLVTKLKPSQYNYKIDSEDCPKMYGLIAQDLEESLTEVGIEKNSTWLLQHEPKDDEKQSDYSLDYGKLTPILIKAIQEQQDIIEDLKSRIETLEG